VNRVACTDCSTQTALMDSNASTLMSGVVFTGLRMLSENAKRISFKVRRTMYINMRETYKPVITFSCGTFTDAGRLSRHYEYDTATW